MLIVPNCVHLQIVQFSKKNKIKKKVLKTHALVHNTIKFQRVEE